jgi:hypothetical protein
LATSNNSVVGLVFKSVKFIGFRWGQFKKDY